MIKKSNVTTLYLDFKVTRFENKIYQTTSTVSIPIENLEEFFAAILKFKKENLEKITIKRSDGTIQSAI